MSHSPFDLPGVAVGFALFVGALSQVLATHLKVPGIVLLLLAGVLLGPDVADIIRPAALGGGLNVLVGFAVAVILFEGGLNLDLKRLRRSSRAVRQLVLRGALITAVVATVLARFAMGWSWGLATLFGCLVIVTGPTVIGPLMRRLQVEPNTAAVLEGEGVLIDPLGAVVAVVALEFVLSPTVQTGFAGLWELTAGLGFGSVAGVVFGAAMAQVLRRENVIPEGMTNIFTLSAVIALFQGANALVHESGLAAVTVAGIVVRRMHTPVQEELIEFKEQLTMLLIGMLFVLLAADVRLADVRGLGWGGIWVVLGMMLLVRPLNVFLGTWGAGLRLRQQLFLSWIGPRGIVSAAVASLVAVKMAEDGLEGGPDLRALVFLVIAATVITAGLTGGMVARGLKLRRPAASGWLILGAHPFGRSLAGLLASRGEDVTVLDRNAHDCRLAEEAGFRVVYGNALRANTLKRANLESRAGVIALTRNDEVNLLFINRCRKIFRRRHPTLLLARSGTSEGVTEKIARDAGAEPVAGQGFDVGTWSHWLSRGQAQLAHWVRHNDAELVVAGQLYLPLAVFRGKETEIFTGQTQLAEGDEVVFLVNTLRESEAHEALKQAGYRPLVAVEGKCVSK